MKALFAHDHPFHVDGESVTSTVGFGYDLWRRYLRHAPSLEVLGRSSGSASGSILSSGPDVCFTTVPPPLSPRHVSEWPRTIRTVDQCVQRNDLVVARLPSVLGGLAAEKALRRNTLLIVEMVGDPAVSLREHGHWLGPTLGLAISAWTRSLVRRAPHVIYVTERALQREYPTQGKSTHASNVEGICLDTEVLRQRLASLPLDPERLVLGSIGSLNVQYKAYDVAMASVARLRAEGLNVTYRILGGGDQDPWRARAAALGVAESVEFTGVLPGGEAVYRWLDDIDAYVQPSRTEGLPRAVIEAMSRACPVFGSDAGGIPELVPAEAVHAAGDHEQLAEHLRAFVFAPDMQRQRALASFERAHDYRSEVLDRRRAQFFADAIASAA